jgi:ElaB/YqjD/DUF883 family membrane-anchored ribosome-binding protein
MSHNKRQTMISDAIDTVSDKTKDAVEEAAELINSAADRAKELAASAKERMRNMASETGHAAVQAKDKMLDLKTTAAEKASAAVHEVGHELTGLIRRYPLQSLLVGVAVGFMLARTTIKD